MDAKKRTRPNERLAQRRFREIERQLPLLLRELRACDPHRRDVRPAVPKIPGVYLFSEEGVHRYVGRTRNCNRRLGEHIGRKAAENSAPFAFNIAKRTVAEAGLQIAGTRAEIAAHPGFEEHFSAAKERIRAMEFRFVLVEEPVVSAIFEVYAAIALKTEGDFNLFDTH